MSLKKRKEKTMMNLLSENKIKLYKLYDNALDLLEAGKYREAVDEYLKVLDLDHNYYKALIDIGSAFDALDELEQALFYLKKAIELEPADFDAHYNCGCIYQKQKEYHLAIEEYTSVIKFNSLYYNVYEERGECYVQIGKYDNALEDFKDAVNLNYPEYLSAELVTLVKPDEYNKWAIAYEKLITAGFLPYIRGDIQKCIIIGPYRTDRIILKPQEIYVKKSDKRHLNKIGSRYELCFDAGFNAVMDRLDFHYGEDMVRLRNLYPLINQYANTVKFVSVALYMDGQLAAGELGILAKKTYLSLTGFHDASSAGSAQLILLAGELVKRGIELWDFGPSTCRWDAYKLQLGAKRMMTENYQKLIYSVDPVSETIFTKKEWNQKAKNILGRMLVTGFDPCAQLYDKIIQDSVASIRNYAFSDCRSHIGVIPIRNSVKRVEDDAFSRCMLAKKVDYNRVRMIVLSCMGKELKRNKSDILLSEAIKAYMGKELKDHRYCFKSDIILFKKDLTFEMAKEAKKKPVWHLKRKIKDT
jgi:tetratricopeptide (TPR) repeat protein